MSVRSCIISTFPFSEIENNDFLGLFLENQCNINNLLLAAKKNVAIVVGKLEKIFLPTFALGVLIFFTLNAQKLTKIIIILEMIGYV